MITKRSGDKYFELFMMQFQSVLYVRRTLVSMRSSFGREEYDKLKYEYDILTESLVRMWENGKHYYDERISYASGLDHESYFKLAQMAEKLRDLLPEYKEETNRYAKLTIDTLERIKILDEYEDINADGLIAECESMMKD